MPAALACTRFRIGLCCHPHVHADLSLLPAGGGLTTLLGTRIRRTRPRRLEAGYTASAGSGRVVDTAFPRVYAYMFAVVCPGGDFDLIWLMDIS